MTTPETNETDPTDHAADIHDAADTQVTNTQNMKDTTMTNDTDNPDGPTSGDDTGRTGTVPTAPRPLGYWLRVIDRRLDDEMRELFDAEGLTRRDWRRLNLIGSAVADPRIAERLAARPEKVAPLVERGWVEGEPGAWRLTGAGVAARDHLLERVTALRATVAGAVSPEEFATTVASLEAIARTLGWSEDERMPRGPRRDIRHPHVRRHRHHGEQHPHHVEHPCGGHHGGEHHGGGHHRPAA